MGIDTGVDLEQVIECRPGYLHGTQALSRARMSGVAPTRLSSLYKARIKLGP